MTNKTPLINILTSGLPGNVVRPLYQGYNSRRREIDRFWANLDNKKREHAMDEEGKDKISTIVKDIFETI